MSFAKARTLNMAKGYTGRNKNVYRVAVGRVEKGLQYAFAGRKLKKRENRSQWIQQVNAAVRGQDLKYSTFVRGLATANILLDRKILADISISEPLSFHALVQHVKDLKVDEQRIAKQRQSVEERRQEIAEKTVFKPKQGKSLSLREEARLADNLKKINKQLLRGESSLSQETKRLEKLLAGLSLTVPKPDATSSPKPDSVA
jgi:large subunit ribosomal protein L20